MSIVGSWIHSFLTSMSAESVTQCPNMGNSPTWPKTSRPKIATGDNSATRDLFNHDNDCNKAWGGICSLLLDKRWTKYVNNPFNENAKAGAKDLLSVDGVQPPFFLNYDRITKQLGSLKGEWNTDSVIFNNLMAVAPIVSILWAGIQNVPAHEASTITSEERMKLIHYIA